MVESYQIDTMDDGYDRHVGGYREKSSRAPTYRLRLVLLVEGPELDRFVEVMRRACGADVSVPAPAAGLGPRLLPGGSR